MATLALGVVGTLIGGPVGGLIGSFLGGSIDRRLFGGGRRQGPRVADLRVQSSAYGEPIPRVYGRLRVAGNVIWSPGIAEHTSRGSSKRGTGTSYSYSASFAVALAARPILGVGRIWSDGKLMKDAQDRFVIPATVRVDTGDERQAADPLISAAEGANAPAYRGLAYAVFEDLALGEFANRIPNLTFELIADAGEPDCAEIAADLGARVGVDILPPTAAAQTLHGFVAGTAGSALHQIEPLLRISGLGLSEAGEAIALQAGGAGPIEALADIDLGATPPGSADAVRLVDTRAGREAAPEAIAIGYFDPARDYQLGLQRNVRRTPVVRTEQDDLPVALSADAAKQLADAMARRLSGAVTTAELQLPWRYAGIAAGATVEACGLRWRVRKAIIEELVVKLSVETLPGVAAGPALADPGRSAGDPGVPPGATLLTALDLPPLPGPLPTTPRIWLAVGGETGWRRADVEMSLDNGANYAPVGSFAGPATIGIAATALADGPSERWDRGAGVEVLISNTALWLESRGPEAVLAGANLALLGDEIIQFADAEALAPGRFRLTTLLRGRRGTEAMTGAHLAGERFVLLDPARLVPVDLGLDAIGSEVRFRAFGSGDLAGGTSAALALAANCLRPLAPAHVRAAPVADGGVALRWTRRSRAGFGWQDGTDAPLGEEGEAWLVEVLVAGEVRRSATTASAHWTYTAADRLADGMAAQMQAAVRIRQISAAAGLGTPAGTTVALPAI